ncbi:hypothetical protein Glove_329g19 [Diversispora epigaea]|uniref:Uncharacterized protein n=1 Tax=Diversispora epigaea TaxID=1348612 RepID=A0A397HK20_9GLOM|nr:hypothetical protein Glove_329g19 [Diversispora epigaea]
MSENSFTYLEGEIKVFKTSRKNIQVKIEGLNEDIARVFLVNEVGGPIIDIPDNVKFRNVMTNKNLPLTSVNDRNSYLVTWIYTYELLEGEDVIFRLELQREQKKVFGLALYLKKLHIELIITSSPVVNREWYMHMSNSYQRSWHGQR